MSANRKFFETEADLELCLRGLVPAPLSKSLVSAIAEASKSAGNQQANSEIKRFEDELAALKPVSLHPHQTDLLLKALNDGATEVEFACARPPRKLQSARIRHLAEMMSTAEKGQDIEAIGRLRPSGLPNAKIRSLAKAMAEAQNQADFSESASDNKVISFERFRKRHGAFFKVAALATVLGSAIGLIISEPVENSTTLVKRVDRNHSSPKRTIPLANSFVENFASDRGNFQNFVSKGDTNTAKLVGGSLGTQQIQAVPVGQNLDILSVFPKGVVKAHDSEFNYQFEVDSTESVIAIDQDGTIREFERKPTSKTFSYPLESR